MLFIVLFALIVRLFILRYYHKWEFGRALTSNLSIDLIALMVRTFILMFYHKSEFGATLMSSHCRPGLSNFPLMLIHLLLLATVPDKYDFYVYIVAHRD